MSLASAALSVGVLAFIEQRLLKAPSADVRTLAMLTGPLFSDADAFAARFVGGRCVTDDVEHTFVVQGEVVGEPSLLLPGENVVQVVLRKQLTVCIARVSWRASETAVVVLTKLVQVGVAGFANADSAEPELFDESILTCLVARSTRPFRGWRVGTDDVDVEVLHRCPVYITPQLGRKPVCAVATHILVAGLAALRYYLLRTFDRPAASYLSMPSQLHECLLLLFRNRPVLAAELLREVLRLELPAYTEVRIESAELTQVQPAEYRADLVVLLDADQRPVFGIVVEVQLAPDEDKRFSWPVYAVDLRARKRCPVCVLVFTAHEHVVRWASRPIELGAGNSFSPLVIGPSGVPAITDPVRAAAEPELAVLSAMAHGQDDDTDSALRIALAAMTASVGLDPGRSVLYCDLVLASLSEATRKALLAMDPAKYEFQSEFARRYLSQGRAEGEAGVLIKLLTLRFGPLSQNHTERIRSASLEELDLWTERVLTATTLDDVLR